MKITYRAMVAAMLICTLFSCKKKDEPPVKSVEDLVRGKAWSGDIKYSSEWADQVFYVQFNNSDNRFSWSEARGTYGGVYIIDEAKREVKMTFDGSGSKV